MSLLELSCRVGLRLWYEIADYRFLATNVMFCLEYESLCGNFIQEEETYDHTANLFSL